MAARHPLLTGPSPRAPHRVWKLAGTIAWLSGCASPTPPVPPKPSAVEQPLVSARDVSPTFGYCFLVTGLGSIHRDKPVGGALGKVSHSTSSRSGECFDRVEEPRAFTGKVELSCTDPTCTCTLESKLPPFRRASFTFDRAMPWGLDDADRLVHERCIPWQPKESDWREISP